jgi:hypothetical protein
VVAPGPEPEPEPEPEPDSVIEPVVSWLLTDVLVVVAPLFIAEPGPRESVGEGSRVLAERVMPVTVLVLSRFGELCVLGRVHSGPDYILEADKSRRLRLGGPRLDNTLCTVCSNVGCNELELPELLL